MAAVFLLGPQRPAVNFDVPFRHLHDTAPVAVITAGAQEAEGDNRDLAGVVDQPLIDLQLYQRTENILANNDVLREHYRHRQDQLQELQRLYRLRLRQQMRAARELLSIENGSELLQHEQRHAISQQRALDRHHLQRIAAIHQSYAKATADLQVKDLRDHAAEVISVLRQCKTVAIFGGNVAILLNRMRLFGLAPLLHGKNIVACSAGAMVLTERIVLFHDKTPGGSRDAEVFDAGLGLIPRLVVLPDASQRLRLKNKTRIALFSRRFAPARCLTLDSGAFLHYENNQFVAADQTRRLSRNGQLRRFSP